ncbi:MAG: hypothetical protein IIC91_01805 [Chloroflexi bacterium]|nr:hypothetical protein [Chloroflexota bacterium]
MTDTTSLDIRLHRVRDKTQAILDRLDAGEPLSGLLSQAKAVTDDAAQNPVHSYWIEFEIYGLDQVPLTKHPFSDPDQTTGCYLFTQLHTCKVDPKPTADPADDSSPRGDKVDPNSIGSIEDGLEYWDQHREEMEEIASVPSTNPSNAQTVTRWARLTRERKETLRDVRAWLYEHISRLNRWAFAEIENIRLLGPDYRIVLESLDALETNVREELVAALENLSSSNPAAWSACALVCRNVVLALGRTLFTVAVESYESELDGKTLDLKGEKELNRLLAFIDYHWRRAPEENREPLSKLGALAISIYRLGSAGKQQGKVRHGQAQRLAVDAFELVAGLNNLVGLEPITSL